MRYLAIVAFFALQLSVFTCGFDLHVHAANSDIGHIAEHFHDQSGHHKSSSTDDGCHLHASHTLSMLTITHVELASEVSFVQHFYLKSSNMKDLSFLIEYPPKRPYC